MILFSLPAEHYSFYQPNTPMLIIHHVDVKELSNKEARKPNIYIRDYFGRSSHKYIQCNIPDV
jgi:hypothetical protein